MAIISLPWKRNYFYHRALQEQKSFDIIYWFFDLTKIILSSTPSISGLKFFGIFRFMAVMGTGRTDGRRPRWVVTMLVTESHCEGEDSGNHNQRENMDGDKYWRLSMLKSDTSSEDGERLWTVSIASYAVLESVLSVLYWVDPELWRMPVFEWYYMRRVAFDLVFPKVVSIRNWLSKSVPHRIHDEFYSRTELSPWLFIRNICVMRFHKMMLNSSVRCLCEVKTYYYEDSKQIAALCSFRVEHSLTSGDSWFGTI